jgi:hypothetical protein
VTLLPGRAAVRETATSAPRLIVEASGALAMGPPAGPGRIVRTGPVPVAWNPQLPLFASEKYLRLLASEYGWFGGFDAAGDLACFLPFVVIRKSLFRLVRFPVETVLLKPDVDAAEEKAFLNAALGYLRTLQVDAIVPATFNSLFRVAPDGASVARYENLIVDLRQSEDALWQAIHHKHRNVIRNAMRQGVAVRSGIENLEVAYQLTLASFLRSARGPFGRSRVRTRLGHDEFCRIVRGLGGYVEVMVAEHGGTPQCAAVIPFSGHCAYYLHGGSVPKPATGAGNLLQWEAIRRLRELGVERYNLFGIRAAPDKGSKAEGIRKFKERFGGKVQTGLMWKFPFRRGKYALYQLAAWLRNGGDVVDQERRRLTRRRPPSATDEAAQ